MQLFVSDTPQPQRTLFAHERANELVWEAFKKSGLVDDEGNFKKELNPNDPKVKKLSHRLQWLVAREADRHVLAKDMASDLYEYLKLQYPLPPFGQVQTDLEDACKEITNQLIEVSRAAGTFQDIFDAQDKTLSLSERFQKAGEVAEHTFRQRVKRDPLVSYELPEIVKSEIEAVLRKNNIGIDGFDETILNTLVNSTVDHVRHIFPEIAVPRTATLIEVSEKGGKPLIQGKRVSAGGETDIVDYTPRVALEGWQEALADELNRITEKGMSAAKAAEASQRMIGKWMSNPIKQGYLYAVAPSWLLWPVVAKLKPEVTALETKLQADWWGDFLKEHPKIQFFFATSDSTKTRKLLEQHMWNFSKRYLLSKVGWKDFRLYQVMEFNKKGKRVSAPVFTPFYSLQQFTRSLKRLDKGSNGIALQEWISGRKFFKGFTLYRKRKDKQEDDPFLWWAAVNLGRGILWVGRKAGTALITRVDNAFFDGRIQGFYRGFNNWWLDAEIQGKWYGKLFRNLRIGGSALKSVAAGWKGGAVYSGVGYLISGGNPFVTVVFGMGGWAGKSFAAFAQSEGLIALSRTTGRLGEFARWLLKFRVPLPVEAGALSNTFTLIQFPIKGVGIGGVAGYFVTGGNPVGALVGSWAGGGIDYGISVAVPLAKYKALPFLLERFPTLNKIVESLRFLKYWKGGALGAVSGAGFGIAMGWPWYLVLLSSAAGAAAFGTAEWLLGRLGRFLKVNFSNIPVFRVFFSVTSLWEMFKNPKAFFGNIFSDLGKIFGKGLSLGERLGALGTTLARIKIAEIGIGLVRGLRGILQATLGRSGLGQAFRNLLRYMFAEEPIFSAIGNALKTFASALISGFGNALRNLAWLLTTVNLATFAFFILFTLHFVVVVGGMFALGQDISRGTSRSSLYSPTTGELLMSVSKSVNPSTANAGETLTYTITFKSGEKEITEAKVYDDLEITYDGFLIDFSTFSPNPVPTSIGEPPADLYNQGSLGAPNFKRITWEIGTMAPSTTYTITFTVKVHDEYNPEPSLALPDIMCKSIENNAVGLSKIDGKEESVSDTVLVNACEGSAPNRSPTSGCVTSRFRNPRSDHNGVDIGNTEKTAVYSPFPGPSTVAYTAFSSSLGYFIVLKSGAYTVTLGHLYEWPRFYARDGKPLIRINDTVEPYEWIGLMGDTGSTSTGPHLHYEVQLNGKYVDPEDYGVELPYCLQD